MKKSNLATISPARWRSALAGLAALTLLATGCSSGETSDPDGTNAPVVSESQPIEETQSSEQTQSSEPTTTTSDEISTEPSAPDPTSSDTTADEPGDDTDDANPGSVAVSIAGEVTTVTPTDVYCSGEPGNLRHLIAKTDNRLPLIEVAPEQIVLVKLVQRGAPHKAQNPSGVTVDAESVSFTDTVAGTATLNGSLTCTAWEN